MYKACGRCGKIHDVRYPCKKPVYNPDDPQRAARSGRKWREKSEEIRERANYLCEVCRDEGVYTYDGLEVHHIVKLAAAPDGLLDNYNLVCLCSRHHHEADDGLIDIEYLRRLAKAREE